MGIKIKSKIKGSISVEASLVFPIILFILMLILYIMFYIYEMVCLQSILNDALNEFQMYYEDIDYKRRIEDGIYCERIDKDEIANQIAQRIKINAKQQMIIKEDNELHVEVNINKYLICQKIELKVSKEIEIPILRRKYIPLKVKGHSEFYQSTDCIRGIDLIDDLSSELEGLRPIRQKYDDILYKIEDTINSWI